MSETSSLIQPRTELAYLAWRDFVDRKTAGYRFPITPDRWQAIYDEFFKLMGWPPSFDPLSTGQPLH